MKDHYVAIMAGGIGSRFWPKSRTSFPKQFIDILGLGKSLLQLTYDRFAEICPERNIYIVTNKIYEDIVKEQLPGLKQDQILCEPMRRNTAPCIAYVAHKVRKKNPNARMVVAPSDHLVMKEDVFAKVINDGLNFVKDDGALVTLGIVPTRPDTGYGYIQFHDDQKNGKVYKVKTFTEKPTLELAKKFIKSGEFLWNSGIFIWSVNSIIDAFSKQLPDIYEIFQDGEEFYNTKKEVAFIEKAYSMCKNISIDYGIMEKANNVYVIPADIGWSDLGTWQSLYDRYEKDYLGNAVSGSKVMIYDAKDCMVMAPDDKLLILQGLDNFCVIDTEDALLICKRDKEQEIKQMTADIKKMKGEQYL